MKDVSRDAAGLTRGGERLPTLPNLGRYERIGSWGDVLFPVVVGSAVFLVLWMLGRC